MTKSNVMKKALSAFNTEGTKLRNRFVQVFFTKISNTKDTSIKLQFLLFISILNICASNAYAQSDLSDRKAKTSASFNACVEQSGGATFAMQDCTVTEITKQKKALSQLYTKTLSNLPLKRQIVLKNSQRAWTTYYKTACEVYRDGRLGQSSITNTDGCYFGLMLERVQTMQWLYDAAKNVK